MIEICAKRQRVLDEVGHILVLGGPGSGKTTLALHKAIGRIKQGMQPGQSILFLSFSRAAVARILDAAQVIANREEREQLWIQTFHSFFWRIVNANAYLLGVKEKLTILLPQDEKALSGGLGEDDPGWDEWVAERERLFREEGRIAFDLFASHARTLLEKSSYLLQAVAGSHPLIIVDEAQDTGQDAWRCVEMLSAHTKVLCLADLDQQIFDYLPGVGPERVDAIRQALNPLEEDLGEENHRSGGTDILVFGNAVLRRAGHPGPYRGVARIPYRPENPPPNWNQLLRRALSQLSRDVRAQSQKWPETIAILVGNNLSALRMSNALNGLGTNPGKPVRHKLLFDEAESLLSARFAAFLLEPKSINHVERDVAQSLDMIAAARRATGKARTEVAKLLEQAAKVRAGTARSTNLLRALRTILTRFREDGFSGDPAADWLAVKHKIRATGQAELVRVANQLDYLVAFRRGHRISAALANEWLRDGAYTNARMALDTALAQEQILDGVDPPRGLQVMNMHKAKGKQFDGVIIIREARRTGHGVSSSFVWRDDPPPHWKSRKVLRVAITRARISLLVLDPYWPDCPLLRTHNL